MSETYPLPSYAAHIWTKGDRIVLQFPGPATGTPHSVEFPNNDKGLALALSILRKREQEQRLYIAQNGAPTKYQVERMLVEDKKYIAWLKGMKERKEVSTREKAEAEALLREIGFEIGVK